MNKRLYVIEWNPSGTNDLLVVDADSNQVIASLTDALFGINVRIDTRIDEQVVVLDDGIGMASLDEVKEFNLFLCEEISLQDAIKRRAVNPVDIHGRKLLNFLEEHFGAATVMDAQ